MPESRVGHSSVLFHVLHIKFHRRVSALCLLTCFSPRPSALPCLQPDPRSFHSLRPVSRFPRIRPQSTSFSQCNRRSRPGITRCDRPFDHLWRRRGNARQEGFGMGLFRGRSDYQIERGLRYDLKKGFSVRSPDQSVGRSVLPLQTDKKHIADFMNIDMDIRPQRTG